MLIKYNSIQYYIVIQYENLIQHTNTILFIHFVYIYFDVVYSFQSVDKLFNNEYIFLSLN